MNESQEAPTNGVYGSLRSAWIPLLALCLAFFVEMVDNTLMTIALPTIGRDLGSGTTALQWVTGAYSLTFGGLLLTAGSAADRLGRRRVLLVGLALFGMISLAVMWVNSAGELIILRAALGIAAAAMAPITNSLVFRLFEGQELRQRAMTLMIVVGMSGFILGPLLGGYRTGARALGVVAARQRSDRSHCVDRRPARRAGRPAGGPDPRPAGPSGGCAEHRDDRAGLLHPDQRG